MSHLSVMMLHFNSHFIIIIIIIKVEFLEYFISCPVTSGRPSCPFERLLCSRLQINRYDYKNLSKNYKELFQYGSGGNTQKDVYIEYTSK